MKDRKKPVIVEAIQWNGKNVVEVYNFLEDEHAETQYEVNTSGKNFYIKFENGACRLGTLMIKTLEGEHKASIGDYIIKGVNGEFYPCKPDIFEKTYEIVNDDEISYQLTVEEIEALSRYYQNIMKIISRNMLNIFELAYTVDNYDLELCINAIDKLQKQKEKLKNGLQQRD